MKKILSSLLLALLCVALISPSIASANSLDAKKTNKLSYASNIYSDENMLSTQIFETKSQTYKINVPSGSLYINSYDENTPFKIEIINSKKKTVKTFKSQTFSGYDKDTYGISGIVSLSKGTYTLKISSTKKKNLENSLTLGMLKTSKNIKITPNFNSSSAVKANTSYTRSFTLSHSSEFIISPYVYTFENNRTQYIPYTVLRDSKGRIISAKDESHSEESFYDAWIVELEEGDYTLEITPSKGGLLNVQVTDYYLGY